MQYGHVVETLLHECLVPRNRIEEVSLERLEEAELAEPDPEVVPRLGKDKVQAVRAAVTKEDVLDRAGEKEMYMEMFSSYRRFCNRTTNLDPVL